MAVSRPRSPWLSPCMSLLAVLVLALQAAGKGQVPRFKWGQTKDNIFISVMVRDLDPSSVSVSLPSEGELQFRAKAVKGAQAALDLSLREDVKLESLKWEVAARPDKWGTAVVISLAKQNAHRWDLLVTDPKPYKGNMDKDWSREDQTLEPEEEVPYADEHSAYLTTLTQKNFNKTVSKFGTLVVSARYPWCSQCATQDAAFAKAGKAAKANGKREAAWKKVGFGLVDAREERALARQLEAKCDNQCKYWVFSGSGEEPVMLRARYGHEDLLAEVAKFLLPAVTVLGSQEEAAEVRAKNTTCQGAFSSASDPKYLLFQKVAGLMRGELVFAATFGAEGPIELWPHNQNTSFTFDGTLSDNGTALHDWVRPRAIPLLQEYSWHIRDTYEKLGLPLASIWLNDEDKNPSFDKIVRHVARRLAKRFIGKIAFVEKTKSSYSYELHNFGLSAPELYPAFAIASNASYQADKYSFEVTPDIAASVQELWKDPDEAFEKMASFCERVLAGTQPQAHETGAAQTNWTAGAVKQIVWKTYKELDTPEKPLLLEVYGKYRADNDRKLVEVENLAKTLEGFADSFIVARYDAAENYLPAGEIKREKYASDSEWYWVPVGGRGLKKLTKPKKDAPVSAVLDFAKKQSGLEMDVEALKARYDELTQANPPPTTTPRPPTEGLGSGLEKAEF